MQEGHEEIEEENIEEGVQEHMSGTEIDTHIIEEDEEEYDSDDGSVYMNFQFNQMKMQRDGVHDGGMAHAVSMTNTDRKLRKMYLDTDLLINTGSTCSVFKNARMLTDVKQRKTVMRTVSNGGHQDSRLTGMFPGFFRVWLNPDSILIILSMSDVTDQFRVTMDSNVDNAINVHVNGK